MSNNKIGVLLINLGTPDSPSVFYVAKYLREFLSDYRVIDIPAIFRNILLYGIILPFRSFSSARLYKSIWQKEGSPLLINTKKIKIELDKYLGGKSNLDSDYTVEYAMRYGNPSIKSKLKIIENKKCDKVIIIPLYPQYASSSSGSSIENVCKFLIKQTVIPEIKIVSSFYNNEFFILSWVNKIKNNLSNNIDNKYFIFSYHGLPERQIKNLDKKFCYKNQCHNTSDLIAKKLNLTEDKYQVAFQSRLGKTPWIRPYIDELLPGLIKIGIKDLVVACPSFIADCLETIEEIGIGIKEEWTKLGGNSFKLIPCLNDDRLFIECLADLVS